MEIQLLSQIFFRISIYLLLRMPAFCFHSYFAQVPTANDTAFKSVYTRNDQQTHKTTTAMLYDTVNRISKSDMLTLKRASVL